VVSWRRVCMLPVACVLLAVCMLLACFAGGVCCWWCVLLVVCVAGGVCCWWCVLPVVCVAGGVHVGGNVNVAGVCVASGVASGVVSVIVVGPDLQCGGERGGRREDSSRGWGEVCELAKRVCICIHQGVDHLFQQLPDSSV
jgi:hypothetical protein